ncbi:MAG: hypothetical protein LBC70_10030 [Chitinispirillales bacterium]|nr:hypothetical protein [Chitinispirillales bacterium]
MTEAAATLIRTMKPDEEGFEAGAKRLSGFFRRTEERFDAGDLLESLFLSDASPKIIEYILFCFLHVGRSDIDTAAGAMRMRRLRILLLRAMKFAGALSAGEKEIILRMRADAGLKSMVHFYKMYADAREWFNTLFAREPLDRTYSDLLALLIECEAEALAQRLSCVSDKIDPYDLKEMSKILPLITICEERAQSYKLLAETVRAGEKIGKSIISFEYFMKESDFEKWLRRVGQKEELRKFHNALLNQREKKIPTRALIGISSITRCVLGAQSAPLDWVSTALCSSRNSKFFIDCGDSIQHVAKFLSGSAIRLSGTSVQGDYTQETFASLIGADMLTATLHKHEPEPDVHDLVRRTITNIPILIRLLDNPDVYSKPGLIEHVAKTSRSLAVLTKIASTRELHTGSANTGVPAALLRNPSAIPMPLLSGLISAGYVPIANLREILYARTARREVLAEAEKYLSEQGQ